MLAAEDVDKMKGTEIARICKNCWFLVLYCKKNELRKSEILEEPQRKLAA